MGINRPYRPGYGLILAFLLAGLLLSGLLFLFVDYGIGQFEQKELYTRSAQFNVFLERELGNLAALAQSYAEWQNAYDFFSSPDYAFMDATYNNPWLLEQQIDYVAMIDLTGQRVWCTIDRQASATTVPLLSGQLPSLRMPLPGSSVGLTPGLPSGSGQAGGSAVDHSAHFHDQFGVLGNRYFDVSDRHFFPVGAESLDYRPISGYIAGQKHIFMYCVWPVTDDLRTVAPIGYLLFARKMDASRLSSYLASPHIQAYFAYEPPVGRSHFPLSAGLLNGELVYYAVLSDVLGNSLGAWAISLQRVWRQEALQLFGVCAALMVLGLTALYLISVLLVRRGLVKPIRDLGTRLDRFTVDLVLAGDAPPPADHDLAKLSGHLDELMGRVISQSRELARLAGNDGLTGLANRRRMEEYVDAEVKRILRRGYELDSDFQNTRHAWLSFVMIDIDHFKAYNESYGHPAGDACLRNFAGSLREVIKRPSDLPCRLGGDSFAVVLPETNERGGLITARRICEYLQEKRLPHRASPQKPFLAASLGVAALLVDERFKLDLLMAMADRALLAAKEQGRNRVVGTGLQLEDA
ncbi:MAG: hypothetical protein A2087_01825 [Spirochaetes bacterium GWD1_61_31]|nr:MAG: hypothetical protein A2Y37_10190 [Spirochaetes bacterium GWB1_60_80]OHD29049.1 MAG: hypothetical protein A2004_14450 [Spirochaetes bacterium GWC1_61_12]OHD35917.1 MAG: hypothetical protein A2087_01825 [Spirochaetes bacterium GWD1_61_31]OHD44216.1 MAG: hypothetical protein A2Y35_06655 [Spirochaetes bacterium GWE1_60_18]OHD60424.1 MAG: hypothetical protein A2Y32_00870 [Spirochaetes bacterium GWF1_60_12]HAP43256.1 hypothetical protein [Spirochaetaceae bacterium]